MTSKRGGRIFPLHLTPFEHYMLTDDRPDYPMTFIVQISFEGQIDAQAFCESVQSALERHPLLRAIVAKKKQNRDCWVATDQRLEIDVGSATMPLSFREGEFIDLRKEIGLRMWLRHDEDHGTITAQFHHSVTDGIGSYQFLGDVLWFYAKKTGAAELPDLPELDPRQLRNRLRATYKPEYFQMSGNEIQTEWKNSIRFMMTQVNRLRPSATAPDFVQPEFPGIESLEFDKAWYRRLRKTAQSQALTSNDLLLEKLFVAFGKWNRQNGGLPFGNLCIMVPLDLRESIGSTMPACNIVTYAFVRANCRLIDDVPKLRDKLRQEMAFIKQTRHRSRFTNLMVGTMLYPRLTRWALRLPKCLATGTLSNTGDPSRRFHVDFPKENERLRCGNLWLTGFKGVPPMRRNTRATTSIFTFGRRLTICMRCDPHSFRTKETRQLLNLYEQELRNFMGE